MPRCICKWLDNTFSTLRMVLCRSRDELRILLTSYTVTNSMLSFFETRTGDSLLILVYLKLKASYMPSVTRLFVNGSQQTRPEFCRENYKFNALPPGALSASLVTTVLFNLA